VEEVVVGIDNFIIIPDNDSRKNAPHDDDDDDDDEGEDEEPNLKCTCTFSSSTLPLLISSVMLAFEDAMLILVSVLLLLLFNNALVKESTSNLDRMLEEGDTNGGNPRNSKTATCCSATTPCSRPSS
jgi:hypothetical protein